MSRKKKASLIILSLAILLVLTGVILSRFVAINTPFSPLGNDCFAIVFDKADVLGADKIILREGEKSLTITDPATVKALAGKFVVANSSGLCGYYADKWMEIYNGDRLVRNIHWNDHEDLVVVYEKDAAHPIWPYGPGQITLAPETVAQIDALLKDAE